MCPLVAPEQPPATTQPGSPSAVTCYHLPFAATCYKLQHRSHSAAIRNHLYPLVAPEQPPVTACSPPAAPQQLPATACSPTPATRTTISTRNPSVALSDHLQSLRSHLQPRPCRRPQPSLITVARNLLTRPPSSAHRYPHLSPSLPLPPACETARQKTSRPCGREVPPTYKYVKCLRV